VKDFGATAKICGRIRIRCMVWPLRPKQRKIVGEILALESASPRHQLTDAIPRKRASALADEHKRRQTVRISLVGDIGGAAPDLP
jgi:hypothetical protein